MASKLLSSIEDLVRQHVPRGQIALRPQFKGDRFEVGTGGPGHLERLFYYLDANAVAGDDSHARRGWPRRT